MIPVADSPDDDGDHRVTTQPVPAAICKPGAAYAGRLDALQTQDQRLARRYARLSGWRRLLVGVLVVLALLVERESTVTKLVFIGVPALLLEYLIKRRARVARSISTTEWLTQHYERRLACVEDLWAGTGESGTRYIAPDHPAAADLDLFGVGSLFDRLSIPSTRAGEDTLAGWLLAPAGGAEVRDRQAAVSELCGRLDLREELAYLAGQVAASHDLPHVARWGQAAPVLLSPATQAVGALAIAFTAITLIGGLFFGTGAAPVLIAFALQLGFAVVLRRRAGTVLGLLEDRAFDLASLGRMCARIERERFTSPQLARLRGELADGPASRRLARLHRLHRWAPLALLLAARPQMAMLLDGWRRTTGPAFGRWLAAVGEIEALCALAAYSFECPDDPFPEVVEGGAAFEAEGLGHPLLPCNRCVRNDLVLGDPVRVLIVSGSNMAGKSTLLRAVGVTAVLALAGAPVRAHRLRIAQLAVGATLRVQDSLLTGRSRFQAEVLRVRRLLDMAGAAPPLLFLLDELFQGTNSADRRIGAEAVLRQLSDAGAVGLVTTHDLALTDIADRLNGRAANVHFEDRVENGELSFDYRMRTGVVRQSNGLALMRAVGIEV
jgi:MutS domain V